MLHTIEWSLVLCVFGIHDEWKYGPTNTCAPNSIKRITTKLTKCYQWLMKVSSVEYVCFFHNFKRFIEGILCIESYEYKRHSSTSYNDEMNNRICKTLWINYDLTIREFIDDFNNLFGSGNSILTVDLEEWQQSLFENCWWTSKGNIKTRSPLMCWIWWKISFKLLIIGYWW